jgi:hypothetical protein
MASELSKQALGGIARASRAKFFSQMSLMEDRFRLHADEKARLQRLANLIYETFTWDDVCQVFFAEHQEAQLQLTASLTQKMHIEQQEAKARCEALALELTQLRAALADQQRLHAAVCAEQVEAKAVNGKLGSGSSDPKQDAARNDMPAKLQHKIKQKISGRLLQLS